MTTINKRNDNDKMMKDDERKNQKKWDWRIDECKQINEKCDD
jgi:hypothetical protein